MDGTFTIKSVLILAATALITTSCLPAGASGRETLDDVSTTLKTEPITGVAEDKFGPKKSGTEEPDNSPANASKPKKENKENLEFVRGLYKKLLDRDIDPQGVSLWVNGLNNNEFSKQAVTKAIIGSNEYKQKLGEVEKSPNAASVKSLFKEILGREADGTDLAAYTRDLDSGRLSKEEVRKALLESEEYRAKAEGRQPEAPAEVKDDEASRAVGQIMRDLLRRNPDAENQNQYADEIRKGRGDIASIIKSIENSPEYKKTAQRLKNTGGSDEDYVAAQFRELLNREPNAADTKGYIEDLKKGKLTREGVRIAIMLSDEYRRRLMALPPDTSVDSFIAEAEKTVAAPAAEIAETAPAETAVDAKSAGKVSFETRGITHRQLVAGQQKDFVFFSMRGKDFKRVQIYHEAGQNEDKSPRAIRICVQCPEFDNVIREAAGDNLPEWHKWSLEWGEGSIRFFLDGKQIGKAPFKGHPDKITVGGDDASPDRNFSGQWRNLKVE